MSPGNLVTFLRLDADCPIVVTYRFSYYFVFSSSTPTFFSSRPLLLSNLDVQMGMLKILAYSVSPQSVMDSTSTYRIFELQIRRGKRDNLGIIFHISPLKHVVTHCQICHKICFRLRNKKTLSLNYPQYPHLFGALEYILLYGDW